MHAIIEQSHDSRMAGYSQVQIEKPKGSSSCDDESSPLVSAVAKARGRIDSWDESNLIPACKRYEHSTRYLCRLATRFPRTSGVQYYMRPCIVFCSKRKHPITVQ